MQIMHIFYVHQYFSTPDGAFITRSYEIARRMLERGHKVTMVCGSYTNTHSGLSGDPVNGVRQGMVDGINVVEFYLPCSNNDGFSTRTQAFVKFAELSARLALQSDYDLLFSTSTPLTAGIPGIVSKAILRRPFVFEVRDLWPELPRAMGVIKNPAMLSAMSILEWASYRAADSCVGLAPGITEGILRRGVPGDRVLTVPNGCDLDVFQPAPREALNIPGVTGGDFAAVFCGTHGIANGLDAALDAAGVLMRRGQSNIKLVFIGDGMMKPSLINRAQVEGLSNCIFPDPMPKRQLAGLLGSADAGMMILKNIPEFYYGTSPNKFFDYIASGLPVLVNYPGWLADLIRQNDCGVAVPPDDPEAFADGLVWLRDHPGEHQEMGTRARQLGEREFNRTALAHKLIDWLEDTFRRARNGRLSGH